MLLITGSASGVVKPLWNISANVGLKSPNHADDVQLVQFGFYCMGQPNSKIPDPQFRSVYAAVMPGGAFSPIETDKLIIAIRTIERSRGGTQDGHVSAIPKTGFSYSDRTGKHTLLMQILANNMFDQVPPGMWPRLDKHSKCPTLVANHVKAALTL